MKILYHLSMDDRVKVMFTQSDCVKLVRIYYKYNTYILYYNFVWRFMSPYCFNSGQNVCYS